MTDPTSPDPETPNATATPNHETTETPEAAETGLRAGAGAEDALVVEEAAVRPPHEREWPLEWMPRFLQALTLVPAVTSACRAAGISKATVYRHRDSNPVFAEAWEDAKELQRDNFQRIVYQWATTGLPVEEEREDIDYDENGRMVRRRVYTIRKAVRSERLAELWLKAWFPDRYRWAERVEATGAGGGPVRVESVEQIDREIAALTAELNARARRSGEPVPDEPAI